MLIKNPDSTVKGITIAIGLLFLVSGVISCVAYFNARLHSAENEVYDVDGKLLVGGKPMFPVVGLGSVILGFVLALMPGAFVTSLMYVLGGYTADWFAEPVSCAHPDSQVCRAAAVVLGLSDADIAHRTICHGEADGDGRFAVVDNRMVLVVLWRYGMSERLQNTSVQEENVAEER